MTIRTFLKVLRGYGEFMFVVLPFVSIHLLARIMRVTVGADSGFWPTSASPTEWITALRTCAIKMWEYDINHPDTWMEHWIPLQIVIAGATIALVLTLLTKGVIWCIRYRVHTPASPAHP